MNIPFGAMNRKSGFTARIVFRVEQSRIFADRDNRDDPDRSWTMSTQRGLAAAKSETRNSKLETNSNDQNSSYQNELEKELPGNLNKILRN